MSLRVLVLRAAGTNCDRETEFGFRLAGARVAVEHVSRVASGQVRLGDHGMLVIPGGFSYGDDLSAGRVLAADLVFRLREAFFEFVDSGRPVIGICNGFQALVKAGLLPFRRSPARAAATLSHNLSGRFEDRWTRVRVEGSSFLLDGVRGRELCLPVAHGEGRFLAAGRTLSRRLEKNGQVALRYLDAAGLPASGHPDNPSGSPGAIAAVTGETGNVLGMMPHPERFLFAWNHPAWTRGAGRSPDGLALIRSFVGAASS